MYFVQRLNEMALAKLREVGINYEKMILSPGQEGFLFEEGDLNRLTELLNLKLKMEVDSDFKGITIAHLDFNPRDKNCLRWLEVTPIPKVVANAPNSWNNRQDRDKFISITEEILGGGDRQIRLHRSSGSHMPLPKDGEIHIYLWSTPSNISANISHPKRINNWPIDTDHRAYKSSLGKPLIDEKTDFTYAELVEGQALYVLFYLENCSSDNRFEIYRYILKQAQEHFLSAEQISEQQKKREAEEEKLYEEARVHNVQRLSKFLAKKFTEQTDEVLRKLGEDKVAFERTSVQVVDLSQQVEILSTQVLRLQEERSKQAELINEELALVMGHPEIDQVAVEAGHFIVFGKPKLLKMKGGNKINRRVVSINLSSGEIAITSLLIPIRRLMKREEPKAFEVPIVLKRGQKKIWLDLISEYRYGTVVLDVWSKAEWALPASA